MFPNGSMTMADSGSVGSLTETTGIIYSATWFTGLAFSCTISPGNKNTDSTRNTLDGDQFYVLLAGYMVKPLLQRKRFRLKSKIQSKT